jgi:dTDP-4-amino-4,6-dideoxygalactose transaminase
VTERMQVPLLDLRAQYAPLRARIEQSIREVCDSQQFVLGPRVARLEQDVARYSRTAFAIGVSSGTDALLVALMALDVKAGDEVITSPYTFFATGGVIARLGARPVFCDIDPRTYNLDAGAVSAFIDEHCDRVGGKLVNRRTRGVVRALLPVHLYGQMADMDALAAIARSHDLAIVEDAAQAIGAELADGRRAGSVGDIGCLSFFPTKNLGAFGDAGMCIASDGKLAETLKILRVHGGEPKYYHAVIGGNFRLDELQAAVLLVKLEHLEEWTVARQRNAAYYSEKISAAGLAQFMTVPVATPGYRHIFNQYVIRAERRDALRAYLLEQGVGTEIYYPLALHQQQCFAYLGHRAEDFPMAARAAAETLALPIYPELAVEQLDYVVGRLAAFYRR